MSIQEMKSRLHQLVDTVDDESMLEGAGLVLSGQIEVSRILSREPPHDILDDLTDEQLAGLEKAREEVRNGNYVTLAEHKQKIEKWLSARR